MPNVAPGAAPNAAPGVPGTPAAPASPSTPGVPVDPNVPGTPSAPGAPNAPTPPKPKKSSKKSLYIILGCLAGVLVVAGIVLAVMTLLPKKEEPAPAPVSPSQSQTEPEPEKTPLADLDKEDLLAAFDEMQEEGYVPEDYVSDDVVVYSASHGGHISLLPSYADPDELLELDPYNGDYEVNIDQIDDSFAFISALDENGDIVAEEPVFVIFSMDYLIFEYTMDGTAESGATSLTFVDTSEEFLEKAIPILILSAGEPLSTIYDYSYSVEDDMLTYHVDTIAISDNSDEDTEEPYAVEAHYLEFSVDLSSGALTIATYDEDTGEITELVSSYGLTEEEGLDRYELQCENYHFPEQNIAY